MPIQGMVSPPIVAIVDAVIDTDDYPIDYVAEPELVAKPSLYIAQTNPAGVLIGKKRAYEESSCASHSTAPSCSWYDQPSV